MNEIVTRPDTELLEKLEGLSPQESLAANALMSGGSITSAAEAAGVSRVTLYQWLEPTENLGKFIQTWKRQMVDTARTRVLMMSEAATQAVYHAIKQGNGNLALRLLERIGIAASPATGPTESEAKRDKLLKETANTPVKEPSDDADPLDRIFGEKP